MGRCGCVVCVLVLTTALQDPGTLCHDELEAGAVAAAAGVRGAVVVGEAVAAHAATLRADWDALSLAQ